MPGPTRAREFEAAPGSWRLASAAPATDLAGLVEEYWEVEGQTAPFRERVLPNGFVELMINLGPPHHLITNHSSMAWQEAWVSGLHDRPLVIESLSGTHLVAARLHPLGARCLLGIPMVEVRNSVVDLTVIIGRGAGPLRDRLLAAGSAGERFALLERFVRRRLSSPRPAHDVTRWATRQIEATHGTLRVSTLCNEARVSRKHLNALFADQVGLSPKGYAQLRRFVRVLHELQRSTDVDWSELAYRAGYADQSHLVRDFQRHALATPTELLRARSPDGGSLIDAAR